MPGLARHSSLLIAGRRNGFVSSAIYAGASSSYAAPTARVPGSIMIACVLNVDTGGSNPGVPTCTNGHWATWSATGESSSGFGRTLFKRVADGTSADDLAITGAVTICGVYIAAFVGFATLANRSPSISALGSSPRTDNTSNTAIASANGLEIFHAMALGNAGPYTITPPGGFDTLDTKTTGGGSGPGIVLLGRAITTGTVYGAQNVSATGGAGNFVLTNDSAALS